MGVLICALVGAALGWLAGHVALLVPTGDWSRPSTFLLRLRTELKFEHVLGALLGAVSITLAYAGRSGSWDFLATSFFVLLLTSVLIIDLRHHLVYPVMPVLGFFASLILNPIGGEVGFLRSLTAGAAAAGAFFALFLLGLLLFRVQALGFGDVLLALMIGGMVGFLLMPVTLFLGTVLGAIASLGLLVMRRKAMNEYIPFGSGMCLAAIIILILRGG
ncbi:MAG: A24 family peptidase [Chloroflexota bacterium]|nr:A24 family peptidase [Chloroflexota bacterium]